MDCDYCYIYHAKDTTWRDMPTTMSAAVSQALVNEVDALYQRQKTKPLVVFHGGEPLLAGVRRLRELMDALVERVPTVSASIQTNGTIYSAALERLLLDHRANLTFSLSVDGFRAENDRHRLGLRDQSVYAKIEATLKKSKAAGVLDNILMVVDIKNDPVRIYEFMQAEGAKHYNIILQDGDCDRMPSGKADLVSIDVGKWLWELFKQYSSGPQNFRIKFFDDIALSLLKKLRSIKSPASTYSVCTMTVDTNGEIKQSDTFRINGDGADRIGTLNIQDTSLIAVAESAANRTYFELTQTLSAQCESCVYLDACGGGYPQHRFRGNSYRNPSVYCADYMHLYKNMERVLCH